MRMVSIHRCCAGYVDDDDDDDYGCPANGEWMVYLVLIGVALRRLNYPLSGALC